MNIYVGNLAFNVTDEELKKAFGKFGEVVSAKVITDAYSGRSKGFGFVEMTNSDEAKKAIEELHDTSVSGRNIVVNEARPRKDKPMRRRPM